MRDGYEIGRHRRVDEMVREELYRDRASLLTEIAMLTRLSGRDFGSTTEYGRDES